MEMVVHGRRRRLKWSFMDCVQEVFGENICQRVM